MEILPKLIKKTIRSQDKGLEFLCHFTSLSHKNGNKPKNNGNFLTNTKRAYNKFQIKNVALVLTFFKKTICLQDEQCVCADHRGVLDGAVPGHLPPALPVRHVRVLACGQDHHPHLDCLLLSRLPLRILHPGQLHRQAGGKDVH